MRAYEDAKRGRRLVDFDDLLERAPRRSPAIRPSPRCSGGGSGTCSSTSCRTSTRCSSRCSRRGAAGRPDLCVVGDPNQAIYEWNGADPTLLGRFAEPVGGATIVRLVRPTARAPGGGHRRRPPGRRPAPPGAGGRAAAPGARLRHAMPTRPSASPASSPTHRPGRRWSACGVLVRTHAQLRVIEAALHGCRHPVAPAAPTGAVPDTAAARSRRLRGRRARHGAARLPRRPRRRPAPSG